MRKKCLILLYQFNMKNKLLMVKTIFQVDKSYIRHAKPDGTGRDPSGS